MSKVKHSDICPVFAPPAWLDLAPSIHTMLPTGVMQSTPKHFHPTACRTPTPSPPAAYGCWPAATTATTINHSTSAPGSQGGGAPPTTPMPLQARGGGQPLPFPSLLVFSSHNTPMPELWLSKWH
eukprot:364050-Chlamydomonas_euryale.AAC.5